MNALSQVIVALTFSLISQGALGLVSSSPYSQVASVEQHIQKAQEAINARKYRDAKKELKSALSIRKDYSDAYLLLAEVYRREGNSIDAIDQVKNAIKYDPESAKAHYLLGVLLYGIDRFNDAQQAVEAALVKAPNSAPLYVLKGHLELATSKPMKGVKAYDPKLDSAVKLYEEALRLGSPNDIYVPTVREQLTGLRSYIEFILHEDDQSYIKAKLEKGPRPNYSEEGRRAKVQGVIQVGVSINEQGEVTSVVLLSHLGHGLDEEAVKAARKVKFSPARKAGQPVPFWSRIDFEFQLK